MEFTGERFIPIKELMNDEIAFEHLHRYHNALKLVKGKTVLDIACGEGYGTKILSKSANKVIGIDIDNSSIDHAKKTYKEDNIEFICGNVTDIPLLNDTVDVVVSYETIEHIDETTQKKFLTEIKRVLKESGILIISTPDKANYTDRYSHKNKFHIKEFHKDEFISFLGMHFNQVSPFLQGYEIVDAITEENVDALSKLCLINLKDSVKPFSRKYVIAICSDDNIDNLNFSSVVFQVSKDYLDFMDGIVNNEAHIVELGNWGKSLDKQIGEKNDIIIDQQKKIEEQTKSCLHLESERNRLNEEKKAAMEVEAYFRDLLYKQTITIENLSAIAKERKELLEGKKALEEDIILLRQSHGHAEDKVTEKNKIVISQSETITLLKTTIEQYSNKMQLIEQEKKEKGRIIQLQKEKEQSLHLQRDSLYAQWDILNRRLTEIYNSEGWKVLNIYYKIKGKIIPENSKRYLYLKNVFNWLRGKKEESQSVVISLNTTHPASQEAEHNQNYEIIEFISSPAPVVSVIIPVFNGWAMTYKCLKSIYQNTISTEYEIIVADDGATDETKDINDYVKNITVIKNKENLGFLNNCNKASKTAKGKFILFLNNDTVVRPGWLSSLVDLMEKDKSVGMTGSKFIYPDGRLQEAGGIIWKDASAWNFGNKQSPDLPEFNYLKEVDYISGACILIRAELWQQIGGFDERYAPAYCEDSDLAFEVRQRGYKVVYQPLSEIVHYEGYSHGTDEGGGTATKSYQKLNNEKFYEKWRAVLSKDHFENGQNVFWARDRSRYKKTILVIDHYVPHFDKDAGSKTVFQYLKLFISMNFNVKFIGDNFFRHEPYTTELQQMGIEVLYGPWYAGNWKAWIKDRHDKFDFVLLNRPHISAKYMDFIRENTRAEILYYGHDLHFMRMLKQFEVENKKEILEEAEKWKKIETSLFKKATLVLAPSEQEKELIKGLGITTPVYSIKPYTFDIIPDPITDFSDRKDILFVGGFTHLPNVDAVMWFVREVWPQVKLKISGGKFIIVGSNVTPEIAALATDDIWVAGFVSETDLQELYKKIKLVVVPLRYGAGVKGKTVEAMYSGIPLVATSFGLEGLPGEDLFLTPKDSPADFTNEILKLYNASNHELVDLSKKEIEYIHNHFHVDVVKAEIGSIMETFADKGRKGSKLV